MFKITVLLSFTIAASYGAPGGGTYCGETPKEIQKCINSPAVMSPEIAAKCQLSSECEIMTCMFRESKWLDGTEVNKAKVTAHFEQFAKDHPEWSPAVQHLKTACLGNELKAQGATLNCPAYDIIHCVFASYIKHATPAQWSTLPECSYPHAYAAACPVCPSSCFATQIPIGSCNACFLQPRAP